MHTSFVGKVASMPSRYDEQTRKAVRLVTEHVGDYDSEWAAIKAVSAWLGMTSETLRRWVRQARSTPVRRWGVVGVGAGDPGPEAEERRTGTHDRDLEGRDQFLRAGERPATAVICRFVAEHKARFGVVPICAALTAHGCTIAARTYYTWARRAPSKRALWDTTVARVLAGFYEPDGEAGDRRSRCPAT